MKKPLMPVRIRATPEAVKFRASMNEGFKFKNETDFLVLPMRPASRRAMMEAMARAMFFSDRASTLYEKAEVCLIALQSMAEGEA